MFFPNSGKGRGLMNKVRKSSAAGFFYPSNSKQLKEEINLLLSVSKPEAGIANLIGIISPHAGYIYSGRTAAYAYNLLRTKNFKTVIIISPSHREYFPGISIYDGDAYETPLGEVPINKGMAEKITAGSKLIFQGISGHKEEHAVEVQIPFLQSVLYNFSVVPIVMGDQGKIYINELARKLAEVIDNSTLIVASSDLSHYHNKIEAYELDSIVEKRIEEFDYEGLQLDLEQGNCEACGGGPIIAMMKAASMLDKKKSAILDRSDSGDSTGDDLEVVGYLSAAVYG